MPDKSALAYKQKRAEPLASSTAERIRGGIAQGRFEPGSRLPPEPEFALQLGVSRSTLRESLSLLEREGLVVRRQRVGTTVAKRPFVRHSLHVNYSVRDMIEGSGHEYAVRDAQISFVDAPASIADELSLPAGAPLCVLERIRTADGRPVILTSDHLDARIVERATAPLLPDISFYEWLNDHCGIEVTQGVARVAAIAATDQLAARLDVESGAPIFRLQQVDYTASGSPVLWAQEFHVADVFDVTVIRNGPYG